MPAFQQLRLNGPGFAQYEDLSGSVPTALDTRDRDAALMRQRMNSGGNRTQWGPQPEPGVSGGGHGQWGEDVFATLNKSLTGGGIGDLTMPLFDWRGWGHGVQFDPNKSLMGVQDKLNEDRALKNEQAALQNALLRKQLNPDKQIGGGEGGSNIPMPTRPAYFGKSAYQRAEEDKDFQAQLAHEQAMQNMKLSLFNRLNTSGQFGPRTSTEDLQQIVNNAGSFEPRNIHNVRTEPINPLDIMRLFFS